MDEQNHNHEEALTLIMWHAIDASRTNSTSAIFSTDSETFCLLFALNNKVASNDVVMYTGHLIISIDEVYRKLGKAVALLVRSGCDTTGSLLGKRKTSWISVFLEYSEKEVKAYL
jgi:hypothetical protein